MIKFWAICKNTFVQTIRQPVFAVLLLVSIAFMVAGVPLVTGIMDANSESDGKMLESFTISSLLVAGFFIAAFSAAWVITREIEDKTAMTVISKPISRATFILGRFVGMILAIASGYYICALAALMIIRHGAMVTGADPYDFPVIVLGLGALLLTLILAGAGNYAFNWSFAAACTTIGMILLTAAAIVIGFIGKEWTIIPFGEGIRSQIYVAIYMMFLAVFVITAVATLASTRLGHILTLCVSLGAIIAGSMHDFIFGNLSDKFVLLPYIGWLVPNLTYFYPTDALMSDIDITGRYVAMASTYALCYAAAVVACAIGLFQTRQLDPDEGSIEMPAPIGIVAMLGRIFAALCILAGAEAVAGKIVQSAGWGGGSFAPALCGMIARLTGDADGIISLPLAIVAACVMVVAGVGLWMLFGYFARGSKWSYFLTLAGLAGGGIYCTITAMTTQSASAGTNNTFAAVAFGVLLVMIILPRSIKHFRNQSPRYSR